MNKSQLAKHMADANDMSLAQAKQILTIIIEKTQKSLAEGDPVLLPGFGTFALSYHPEKQGRNPQTGEAMTIPGANKIAFKAGTKLKTALKREV